MNTIKSAIAKVVKLIADFGAGTASVGITYEPKVPAKIRK
ncbi:MAG: cyclic lactone autoinducer peptide [Clostridia bacterium]|nr:cyclic lactone autoinducer peptide [Clostridia bacterium]